MKRMLSSLELCRASEDTTKLYIQSKSRCSKCKGVFPYKEVYWWHGLQLCGTCYPMVTGKPKPAYWR